MGLLDTSTICLAALIAVGLGVAGIVVSDRHRGRRRYRLLAVASLVAAAQLAAVAFAGLVVNAHFGLYASWAELLGHSGVSSASTPLTGAQLDARYHALLLADYQQGRGTVVPLTVPAPGTGLPPQPALVYLPPQYGNPESAAVRFPVVELMDGVPGHPATWLGPLHLQRMLDGLIGSLRSTPFIAVLPTMNVLTGRDTECVNVWHGPAVETYLTADVRAAVLGAVRARSDARAWGIMGYSTGGYCAMNLAMRHPQLYGAAVSMSGYDRPYLDSTTGALFGHSARLLASNTPLVEATHWSSSALNVLAIASKPDRQAFRDALQLRDAARGRLHVDVVILARGGHNFALWSALEPAVFNWLSHQLDPALDTVGLHGTVPVVPSSPAHFAHRTRRHVPTHRRVL